MANARAKYVISAEDKTGRALRKSKKGFQGLQSTVAKLAPVGIAALGVAGLGGAVTAFARSVSSELDDLAKSANRLGIAVDRLDAFNFAAQLAGGSAEGLEKAFGRASKNIVDASQGTGEYVETFERLGISVTDAAGNIKTTESVLLDFADAIPRLGSETEVTAAALEIFGRQGANLIPLLRQGRDAIKDQLVEARALGSRTGELTAKGERFVDAQLRLNRAFRTTKDTIAGALLPSLSTLAETLADKLVGLVSGLSREYRDFLGTLALEAPQTQAAILEEEFQRLQGTIPGLELRLEVLRDKARTMGMVAADGTETWRDTIPGVTDRLKETRAQLEAVRRQLELNEERQENAARIQERITAQRAFELQNKEREVERQGEILNQKAQELILQQGIAAALEESRKISGELGEQPPPFNLDDLPEPETVTEGMRALGDATDRVGSQIRGSLSNSIARLATEGGSAADVFEAAWKSAVGSIVSELTSGLFSTLLGSIIPGGGALGGLLGKTAGAGGGGLVGTGPTVNNITFASLTPATVDDFARADVALQESRAQADRFLIGSRG